MVGNTVLGYHVDEKIGSGGFGTVYKVSKTNAAGTYVRALKHITLPTKKQYSSVLNSMGGDYSKADDYFASILKDIVSEITILSTLSESGTQNIVRYYENDIVETTSPKSYDIYILMEYLTPFTDYIESKAFTVRDVITLGKDILKALMACHEKNIIHRDIKDDNIFVSSNGVYKLGDFGVSKALKDKSRAESVKGTPNFIAPEVYLGKEKYDNTVDLYSLGIVLYKLLNKARNPFLPKYPAPYSSKDEDAAFEARMTGNVPALPIGAENELGEAVLKAIMPRSNRYNTALEFYDALKTAESNLGDEELSKDLGLSVPCEFQPSKTCFGGDMHGDETVVSDALHDDETIVSGAYGDETVVSDALYGDETIVGDGLRNANETVLGENGYQSFETIAPAEEKKPEIGQPPQGVGSPNQSVKNVNVSYSWDTYTPPVTTPRVEAAPKKSLKWLLYLSPVLIAGTWLAVYLILLPLLYDKAVSFVEWFIADPTAIVDAIKDSSNVFTPIYKIILLRVYNWLTVAGLITTLFFIGRSIQNTKPQQSARARLRGKEPYAMTTGILEEIKMVNNANAEKARKAVYSLNERLRNESAFGEGSETVIDCENEIAACLLAIQGLIPGLRDVNANDEAAQQIEMLSQRCLAKLKVRIELKKR